MRTRAAFASFRVMSTSHKQSARSNTLNASSVERVPISALPLPPPSHSLIHALTPDPHIPTPAAWHAIRAERPSLQRRARMLAPLAHFSYVAPCPLPFPFRVKYLEEDKEGDEEDSEAQGKRQVAAVERWLVEREALREVPSLATEGDLGEGKGPGLRKYIAEERDEECLLIGLAETGWRDCVPRLDVGDAFELLGEPSLTAPSEQGKNGGASLAVPGGKSDEAVAARQELIDILSGNAMLINGESEDETLRRVLHVLRANEGLPHVVATDLGCVCAERALEAGLGALAYDFWNEVVRARAEWRDRRQRPIKRCLCLPDYHVHLCGLLYSAYTTRCR